MDNTTPMKRILFVDDEPNILRGLQRLLRSHRREWDMVFANSPEEALQILEESDFHIIVSDLRMPNIDGVQLLTQVKDRYPDMARFILSGHADTDMIIQSVSAAHQFLAKPCDADKLQEAIERACSLRDIFHSEMLLDIVRTGSTIPALPDLYYKLTDALKSQNSSATTIAKIISQDLTMSAKVLQLVNSSFFGLSRRIDDISQAVALLGAEMLNNIVLSAGVFSTYDDATVEKFDIRGIYAHSLQVSSGAGRLIKAVTGDRKQTEEAILAGMMHDLGKLALINSGNQVWEELYLNRKQDPRPLHEVEREKLGITHAEVGAYLLGLWGLSNQVAEAVAFHHQPGAAPTAEFGTLTALHMADVLAYPEENTFDLDYFDSVGIGDKFEEYVGLCEMNPDEQND